MFMILHLQQLKKSVIQGRCKSLKEVKNRDGNPFKEKLVSQSGEASKRERQGKTGKSCGSALKTRLTEPGKLRTELRLEKRTKCAVHVTERIANLKRKD